MTDKNSVLVEFTFNIMDATNIHSYYNITTIKIKAFDYMQAKLNAQKVLHDFKREEKSNDFVLGMGGKKLVV